MPQLRARNLHVASTVLNADLRRAPAVVAERLEIANEAPVFNVVRVRAVDNIPLLIEHSFFPADLVPGMLEADLSGSIYELLQDHWKLAPVRKWESITPDNATEWEQEQLQIPRDHLLLRVSRRSQTASGDFIEYAEDAMRTDVAHIEVFTEHR